MIMAQCASNSNYDFPSPNPTSSSNKAVKFNREFSGARGTAKVEACASASPVEGYIPSAGDNFQSIYRSHDYEELPNSRYGNPDYGYASADDYNATAVQISPRSMPQLLVPPVPAHTSPAHSHMMTQISLETSASDQVILVDGYPHQNYRKRINPLYSTLRLIDNKSIKRRRICGPLMVVSVVALVVAVLALGVAVALLTFTNKRNDSADVEMQLRIISLEQQQNLIFQALNETSSEARGNALLKSWADRIIKAMRSEYTFNLTNLQDDFSGRISNISKMHGPQGPPGVGNLTQCRYETMSGGSTAQPTLPTSTGWIPADIEESKNWRITGITCSTDGGLYAFLVTRSFPETTDASLQFRCECSGQIAGQIKRFCIVHYWSCPLLS